MELVGGLSPRVRGSRRTYRKTDRIGRSIPACAGEPRRSICNRRNTTVYPRVCGGAGHYKPVFSAVVGLSPRVRGSRALCQRHGGSGRSIPACAGEPDSAAMPLIPHQVYPRVCGGAIWLRIRRYAQQGLSPRVRGSPITTWTFLPARRSIPACAGEPPTATPVPLSTEVYPRVCGGAAPGTLTDDRAVGLSPRVRGSLGRRIGGRGRLGSIPACAGEPRGSP